MRVQTRLLTLLALVAAAHMAALAALRIHASFTVARLEKERAREIEHNIASAVVLEGRMIENFSLDYTYWDEMVSFVQTGDRTWAKENLDVSLPVYHAEACWVYGPNFELVYAAHVGGANSAPVAGILDARLRAAFAAQKFPHFFEWQGGRAIEFRGAPIHPTADPERKSPARGYFVIARILDDGVMETLGSLILDSSIRVMQVAPPAVDKSMASRNGRFQVVRPLPSSDGEGPAGYLVANVSTRELNDLVRANGLLMIAGSVFSVVVVAVATWASVAWISRPVRALSKALAEESASGLVAVRGQGHEFGRLAQMVDGFFRQKAELVLEVRRRVEAEEMLRRTNRTLRMAGRCNIAMASVSDESDAYINVVDAISSAGDYPLVWAGPVEVREGKRVVIVANSAGMCQFLPKQRQIDPGEPGKGRGSVGGAVHEGRPTACDSVREEEWCQRSMEEGADAHLGMSLSLPLLSEGRTFGVVGVCAHPGIGFDAIEKSLLSELAENIARAIVSVRARAAHVAAERKALELTERLHDAEKLESLGRLAGGIAHDFNNLVFLIMGNIELALYALEMDGSVQQELRDAKSACWQARDLTERLLAFGGKRRIEARPVGIHDEIQECLVVLRQAVPPNVAVRVAANATSGTITGDRVQVRQVIMNLVKNALQAMLTGGRLEIATEDVHLDVTHESWTARIEPGNYVLLVVRDTGVGIAGEMLGRIFDPFFTTKPGGTGLGLATVHGIVTQHGGHVEVSSVVGEGSVFRVYFPAAPEGGKVGAAVPEGASRRARQGERVLLVEDGAACRRLTRTMLETLGYEVIEAEDGEAALDIVAAGTERFDVVLSDVIMPNMSGRELRHRMRGTAHVATWVFMSGYPDEVLLEQGVMQEDLVLVRKPFTLRQIGESLRTVLDRAGTATPDAAG